MSYRLCIQLLAAALLFGQPSLFEGIWRLDLSKSRIAGSPPLYTSRTIKIEATTEGLQVDAEGMTPDGQSLTVGFSAKGDGKSYPATGNLELDAVAVKQESPTVMTLTTWRGGRTISSGRYEISRDGRVLIVTINTQSEDGKRTKRLEVYEKQ